MADKKKGMSGAFKAAYVEPWPKAVGLVMQAPLILARGVGKSAAWLGVFALLLEGGIAVASTTTAATYSFGAATSGLLELATFGALTGFAAPVLVGAAIVGGIGMSLLAHKGVKALAKKSGYDGGKNSYAPWGGTIDSIKAVGVATKAVTHVTGVAGAAAATGGIALLGIEAIGITYAGIQAASFGAAAAASTAALPVLAIGAAAVLGGYLAMQVPKVLDLMLKNNRQASAPSPA